MHRRWIVATLLAPLVAAAPANRDDDAKKDDVAKREYIDLCRDFSMDQYRIGPRGIPSSHWELISNRMDGVKTPIIKKTAERFELVHMVYQVSWDASRRALFTGMSKDEQARLARLAFEAGLLGDPEKGRKAAQGVMPSLLSRIAHDTKSSDSFYKASEMHAKLWKDLLPVAKSFSGEEAKESPLTFEIINTVNPYGDHRLTYFNNTGKPLHNVTILIETAASQSRLGDSRSFYTFEETLDAHRFTDVATHKKREMDDGPSGGRELPASLLDAVPLQAQFPLGRKYLRYSIWADELRREGVTLSLKDKPKPLFEREPQGGFHSDPKLSKPGRKPVLGYFHRMKPS